MFSLPFKGALFARTLAQGIDATELSVIRPGAPIESRSCVRLVWIEAC